jgi:hypothetical protein
MNTRGKSKVEPPAYPNCPAYRVRGGIVLQPVYWIGCHVGYGNYMVGRWMAGPSKDELVTDVSGKPIPYRRIQFDARWCDFSPAS